MRCIFISPESLKKGTRGNPINDAIRSCELKVGLWAFDEVHLCHEWADFRPPYGWIGSVMQGLWQGVPMLALSATMYSAAYGKFLKCCKGRDVQIVSTPLMKENLQLEVVRTSVWEFDYDSVETPCAVFMTRRLDTE